MQRGQNDVKNGTDILARGVPTASGTGEQNGGDGIPFQTEAQRASYARAGALLTELFGEMIHRRDDAPIFGIKYGSAFAQVSVYPFGEDDAVICTRAYVLHDVDVTSELMRYLLNENNNMRFGAFGLANETHIFFEHSIIGSTVDKAELRASVLAVIGTADTYDDPLMARFGGTSGLQYVLGG